MRHTPQFRRVTWDAYVSEDQAYERRSAHLCSLLSYSVIPSDVVHGQSMPFVVSNAMI